MKSHSSHPILVVPREFGLILSCEGEIYQHKMSPEQQLDLATRLITVAMERMRNGEVEGHEKQTEMGEV